jgi:hypothetical protein
MRAQTLRRPRRRPRASSTERALLAVVAVVGLAVGGTLVARARRTPPPRATAAVAATPQVVWTAHRTEDGSLTALMPDPVTERAELAHDGGLVHVLAHAGALEVSTRDEPWLASRTPEEALDAIERQAINALSFGANVVRVEQRTPVRVDGQPGRDLRVRITSPDHTGHGAIRLVVVDGRRVVHAFARGPDAARFLDSLTFNR